MIVTQMNANWNAYAQNPVSGRKNVLNAASATNASEPPTQIGFDAQ